MSRGMHAPTLAVAVAVATAALAVGGRSEAAESEYEVVGLTTGEVPRAGEFLFGFFFDMEELSTDVSDVRTTQVRTEFSWGLGGSAECGLRLPYNWRTVEIDLPGPGGTVSDTTDEMGDVELLLKASTRFSSGKAALGVRFSADTNGDGNDPVATPFVAATFEGRSADFHVSLGVQMVEGQEGTLEYVVGASVPFDRTSCFLLALDGESDDTGSHGLTGRLGAHWRLAGAAVGAGITFGIDDDAPDWGLVAGVEWRY